ncbi:uncharacterized protein METZ01_LOCUS327835, partial [marine metagenome]
MIRTDNSFSTFHQIYKGSKNGM